jgi:hypothetical protein
MNARAIFLTAILGLSGLAFAEAAQAQTANIKGQLRIPEFAGLAEKASESVNVTLDSKLLGIGCRFLDAADPEEAEAKKVCTGLSGVFVRSFTFDEDFAYPKGDVEAVRKQLSAPGWSRIVGARSRKEQTDVDVFVLIEGDRAQGLAIIASEPREFTIVNIVGSIDLAQLHSLEGKFGVPELEIETKPPAPKKKT